MWNTEQHAANEIPVDFSLLFCVTSLKAQDCNQNLDEATKAYYDGDLREIEPLLADCIKGKNLSRFQKTEALVLLTNSFLVLREDQKADDYMNLLLTHDPEYQLKSSDIIEFRKLYNTYRIQVQYNFGLFAGFNQPDYQVLRYQSYASETIEPEDYTEETGLVLGVSGDMHLWKNFFGRASLAYMSSSFRQQEIILDYQRVASEETQNRIILPIQVLYVYDKWKFKPFIGAGVSFHYLINAKANLDHAPIPPETPSGSLGIPQTVRDYDLTDQRTRFNTNWVMSAGVQRKINKITLEARISYEYGISNLVKESMRYADETLLDTYAYVPDDFKMDNLRFSIGVYRTLSKPVKVNE